MPPDYKARHRTLEDKLQHGRLVHPLREPCKCPKDCISKINQQRRKEIYTEFWSIDYHQRKNFIHHSVEHKRANRRIMSTRRREAYYIYRLRDSIGEEQVVCKLFFLGTLGYGVSSSVVYTAKEAPESIVALPDQRGKRQTMTNPLHELIDSHVSSYNPCFFPDCKNRASNRVYLPHTLTISKMHDQYNEEHPEHKVHYTTYMRRVKALNVSFTKAGRGKCRVCIDRVKTEKDEVKIEKCIDTEQDSQTMTRTDDSDLNSAVK